MNVCGVSLLAAFPRRRTLNLTPMSWVPGGFERFDGGADFMELIGPVYARGDGSARVLGLRVEDRHRNAGGVAHGGLLATLVDFALGRAIEADADDDQPRMTVSLTTDFLRAVETGSWVEAHTRVERLGGTLAFAECSLVVEGDEVVRGRAVFAAA
jgi:acyl-coenzyme A thioesterase 13